MIKQWNEGGKTVLFSFPHGFVTGIVWLPLLSFCISDQIACTKFMFVCFR